MIRLLALAVLVSLSITGCGYRIGGPPSATWGRAATSASIGNPDPLHPPQLPTKLQREIGELRNQP